MAFKTFKGKKSLAITSLIVLCFFLTGCEIDWSMPSLFGLPLGVVVFAFWILTMLNQNQNSGNQSETPPKPRSSSTSSYRSPNLTRCKTCRKDVSKNAEACPYCGEPDFNTSKNAKSTSQKKIDNRRAGEAMRKQMSAQEESSRVRISPTQSQKSNETLRRRGSPRYYYYDEISGNVIGPHSKAEMARFRFENRLNDETQVTKEGIEQWQPYRSILG